MQERVHLDCTLAYCSITHRTHECPQSKQLAFGALSKEYLQWTQEEEDRGCTVQNYCPEQV
ncbi:unnamed protein product, partial [Staurois parvus]